ncbi:MAG: hypothetical protein L3J74_09245 [Bacteroidales bacterium]|nr:hypothetical protein [Bacteroidales bacterium]
MKKGKLLLLFTFLIISIWGNAEDFTKTFRKQYKANKNTTMQLVNKYGDMKIINWDKNEIDITVTITVKTSNELKAESTFRKIDIDFSEKGNLVSAITSLNESIRNTSFKIDYFVKIPAYINVDLSNKYGDLFLNEVNGHANIQVKYGNFTINKLGRGNIKPLNYIYVGYSDTYCDIDQANWLKMEVAYSKVVIETVQALMIASKYSALKIKKVKSIVAESKYDHPFKVGAVRNFICTGGYSSFEISKLYNKLDLTVKYGNLDLFKVDPGFELIKIDQRYGKSNLHLPESYKLEAQAAYGSIKYPKEYKLNKIIDGTESRVWGTVGIKKDTKAKVIVSSRYGNVQITED